MVRSRTGRYGQLGDDGLVASRACGIPAAGSSLSHSRFTAFTSNPSKTSGSQGRGRQTTSSELFSLSTLRTTRRPSLPLAYTSHPPPPPLAPKRSIHSDTHRPSSGLQEISPAYWIEPGLLFSCPRAAAQRSAPLSSRRSTTPSAKCSAT
ncbi:hypothetical protein N7492_004958 [Penicillium capsulatum]|uniref:Uncharacterized protein n=1 Tax=Penicillium capsulatum TaxID=69766 RepID=A0A9W9I8R6_9EURO|nr:hypothetical protein N7492_004958 [Penicillium capsulatum]KAJ6135934.1 hypothetical protein N7512_001094 [Penicillium capsulatum]